MIDALTSLATTSHLSTYSALDLLSSCLYSFIGLAYCSLYILLVLPVLSVLLVLVILLARVRDFSASIQGLRYHDIAI